MSRIVEGWEWNDTDFHIGEHAYFDAPFNNTIRLYGEVVRVYNTRMNYHVEVDGVRYAVNLMDDHMSREK